MPAPFGTFSLIATLALAMGTAGPAQSGAPALPEAPADPVITARAHLLDPDLTAFMFRNMDGLFETRTVANHGPLWEMPHANGFVMPQADFAGHAISYDDFARRTYTNAFLVIRDGKIVFEDYRNRSHENNRFASFSMAKSIVSLMIGKAIEQGAIRSIDDAASDYVPELKGGGYEGVSIRHILQMRSGVDYEERYDFGKNPSLAAQIHTNAIVRNAERFADSAKTIGRKAAPGSTFNYATLDTAVLGWVLERATGKPAAQYLSETIWQPAGMEAPGFWIADGPPGVGRELTGMGYAATLRDYGRLGQLMLQDGVRGKTRILPVGWMAKATEMIPFPDDNPFGARGGYGFQFWQMDEEPGAYAAVGLAGQFIYVHPATRTVIVKLSYMPEEQSVMLSPEIFKYFKQIANQR